MSTANPGYLLAPHCLNYIRGVKSLAPPPTVFSVKFTIMFVKSSPAPDTQSAVC